MCVRPGHLQGNLAPGVCEAARPSARFGAKFCPQGNIRGKEFLPRDCGKGSALRMVNRYLGIPRAGSLCFGDGANDLDMFRAAGTRVAVRGSCPALVQLADSLCGPPSESGIAQELVRRHILPAPPQTQKGA